VLVGNPMNPPIAENAVPESKDRISELGYMERGAKASLGTALKAGLILGTEEPAWAHMMEDRNLASHTYNLAFAEEVSKRIIDSYASTLRSLLSRLKS
jgi:Nucleotidyltransferase substrate binding protein like